MSLHQSFRYSLLKVARQEYGHGNSVESQKLSGYTWFSSDIDNKLVLTKQTLYRLVSNVLNENTATAAFWRWTIANHVLWLCCCSVVFTFFPSTSHHQQENYLKISICPFYPDPHPNLMGVSMADYPSSHQVWNTSSNFCAFLQTDWQTTAQMAI